MVIARRDVTGKNYLGNRADAGSGPNSGRLDYTRVDLGHFEKLMAFDSEHKGARRSSGRADSKHAPRTGYTDSDNRLFEDLMSFDHHRAASPPLGPKTPARSSVHYTPQDLKHLQSLMPGEPTDEREEQRSGRDTDSSHIRIVDFDKEHAKQKENRRQGNADMKIRYFD